MIEVEAKIDNKPTSILIDSRDSHSYIDPKIVVWFKFKICKNENFWLVQLAIGTKRKINEIVKDCLVSMNGVGTKEYLNIIPRGSYVFLIGMGSLDKYYGVLDCYNKTFTFLYEERNLRTMKGIPRPISIRNISSLQLKRSFRKGCQIYVVHME
jgi:hypothetical protein